MSLPVDGGTCVAASPGPAHFLEHERLVAYDHASSHVRGDFVAFEKPRDFGSCRTCVHVTLEVNVPPFLNVALVEVLSQLEGNSRFVLELT